MPWNSTGNYERDDDKAAEREAVARAAKACKPLEKEIEALEEQICALAEGFLRATGMKRAALSKEVAMYRRELDARYRALRRCRGAATPVNANE
jgi:hypothetical protein